MYIIKKSNILKNLGGSDYIIYWVALFMDLLIIISKFHLCFSFLNIWDTPLKRKKQVFFTFLLFCERVLKEKKNVLLGQLYQSHYPYPIKVILKLEHAKESPWRLRFMVVLRVSDSVGLRCALRICIFVKLPVEANGLDKLLWHPLT